MGRRTKYLLNSFVCLLILLGCEKENENERLIDVIEGKWYRLNVEDRFISPLSSDTSRHVTFVFAREEYIQLNNDGGVLDYGGDYGAGNYSPKLRTYTYEVSGRNLILKYSENYKDTLIIENVTAGSLTLYEIYPRRGGTQEHWYNFIKK